MQVWKLATLTWLPAHIHDSDLSNIATQAMDLGHRLHACSGTREVVHRASLRIPMSLHGDVHQQLCADQVAHLGHAGHGMGWRPAC